MPIDQLVLFVAAGLLLNLTPGPDVLYIVSNALRGGARVGMVAALGITAGCFVHIFAAAVGVSALMAASATAFTVLKWLGAAYLVYVGVRLLFSKADDAIKLEAHGVDTTGAIGSKHYKTIFLRGFWTNVLNPKVALFFLAFLPQFIAPTVEHKPLAFLLLGLLFNFNGLWVNIGWALAAARLTQYMQKAARRRAAPKAGESPRGAATREAEERGGPLRWLDRVAGAMFVAFGIKLALTESPNA
ncbi:LysE family translocator [Rhodoferax sp. AJA081-3]|uniref:LysE family translocator n=1 Tax=Rhodoferax sp. AJA081-3 TaxID=2752316 RepID=UPI001ADF71BF|nr:LysE family translocator [Rhodoferax sp. AJA081-3]QTN30343.1 LysE family translocator [Rhodoferax sp. AJA081-3]